MASATSTRKMREEATCSICLNLMSSPMSIACGHSYCHCCIVNFIKRFGQWQPLQGLPCPQCRIPFHMDSLRPNKQLGNLIEAIREQEQELSCEEHGEKLHLFCEDEGQLICWRCERTAQHHGHSTALLEDVCQGYKEKLQEAATKLRQLDQECVDLKVSTAQQITRWKEKVQIQRQKIQSDFKNLQSFLREEEKSHLWRLEKEEEDALRVLRDREASLGQKSQELQSHIQDLERKCQGSAQNLLQDVKGTLNRSLAVRLETPDPLSLELHSACEVSELYLDVRKLLKQFRADVTLDPETAHRELILSEDHRQVTRGYPQENLPALARRFTASPCVLGCDGFVSGKHYFEVDVGEGTGWDVGVCAETVPRDAGMKLEPQCGFWAIRLCKKKRYTALTAPPTPLPLSERPLVVGVFLDCEAGLVAFYSMPAGTHIFSFPRAVFSGALRPYFQVYPYSPLFLPPADA